MGFFGTLVFFIVVLVGCFWIGMPGDFLAGAILFFALFWIIGLIPPVLIRFAFARKSLSRGAAFGLTILLWFVNVFVLAMIRGQGLTTGGGANIWLVGLTFCTYNILRMKGKGSSDIAVPAQPSKVPVSGESNHSARAKDARVSLPKEQAPIMNDDAFYDEVAKEMQENRMIPGVWTRAFAEADGDENRAKAIYIKRRVAQLAENSKQQHEEAKRLMPAGGGQEKTSPPLVETTTTSASRPPVVRGLCVIGFFGTVCGIEMVFSESARNIGVWYPPYLAFSLLVGFVCMVGFWRMRRWAFFTYTGLFALNQIAMLVAGTWSVFGSVIPGVFISIMFSQLSKMR